MIKLKNIKEEDFGLSVYRYLTFAKFMSMLTYNALWFCKLRHLEDNLEGKIPLKTKEMMNTESKKWVHYFPEHFRDQFDNMEKKNEDDGRELTLTTCWFLNESESRQMWDTYVGNAGGVAVKSTIDKLIKYVYVWPDHSQIGKVEYVDFNTHQISQYEASQSIERAFLKDNQFAYENELRIVTLNFKHPRCVNFDTGLLYTSEEITGSKMNNFDNPGLYIAIDFINLIDEIILAPNSPIWFENIIRKMFKMSGLDANIRRSDLEKIKKQK